MLKRWIAVEQVLSQYLFYAARLLNPDLLTDNLIFRGSILGKNSGSNSSHDKGILDAFGWRVFVFVPNHQFAGCSVMYDFAFVQENEALDGLRETDL